ncbi:MAG TPA: metal ABC transporter substrate-binding protein [Herpetosiphonaceae bacterium]
MKRLIIGISLLALLSACGTGGAGGTDTGKLRVVTSMGLLADIAGQVGGERVQVESLVPLGAGPEDYQATPGDSQKIAQARLVIFNGAGLEAWIAPLFENAGAEGQQRLELAAGLPAIDGNPHFWLDPTYAVSYTERIRDALISLDPAGAKQYRANSQRYVNELIALDSDLAAQAATIPAERRQLVTNHDAFPYFARRYGFTVTGVILENPEAELSAGDLSGLVGAVRASGVPAIFAESQFNQKTAQVLAEEAGVKTIAVLYTDSLGGQGAASYIEMMRYNMKTIVDSLK